MSLKKYCSTRAPNDTPAGDVAFDIKHDKGFPRQIDSLDDLIAYLERANACGAAVEAAKALWQEYEGAGAVMKKSRRKVPMCRDCRCECTMDSGHYYMATKYAWVAARAGAKDDLCLDCLETRLGRPLDESDFVALPHEILARFAGQGKEPGLRFQRQLALEDWRDFVRSGAWGDTRIASDE